MKSTEENDLGAASSSPARGQSCSASPLKRQLGRLLMGVGLTGAAFAALCCMAPFLLAGILAAVGFGFLLNDSVLMGLLVVFLAAAAAGYQLLRRQRTR